MSAAGKTKDHDEIRRWVEFHKGNPVQVKATDGLLRINFGEMNEEFEELSWEDFFQKFDESDLTFLYSPDEKSKFNKFVREGEEQGKDEG